MRPSGKPLTLDDQRELELLGEFIRRVQAGEDQNAAYAEVYGEVDDESTLDGNVQKNEDEV